MSGITRGAFWLFQNNTSVVMTLALTNATIDYGGEVIATDVTLFPTTGFTMAYSGNETSYIIL
jgi:hypothetical protein